MRTLRLDVRAPHAMPVVREIAVDDPLDRLLERLRMLFLSTHWRLDRGVVVSNIRFRGAHLQAEAVKLRWAGGCVVFRTGGRESALQISRCWSLY